MAGHKGVKEARFDLLPMDALWFVARVFGKGAEKYAERNWERGLKWGASKGALDRHLALFWAGQDDDEESGLPHLAHVAWHALVMLAMYLRADGDDDRSPHEAARSMVAEVTNPEDIEAARAEVVAVDKTPYPPLPKFVTHPDQTGIAKASTIGATYNVNDLGKIPASPARYGPIGGTYKGDDPGLPLLDEHDRPYTRTLD